MDSSHESYIQLLISKLGDSMLVFERFSGINNKYIIYAVRNFVFTAMRQQSGKYLFATIERLN